MVTIRLHVHLTKKKQMNKVNLSQVLIKGQEELVMEILEIKTTTCGNRSGFAFTNLGTHEYAN